MVDLVEKCHSLLVIHIYNYINKFSAIRLCFIHSRMYKKDSLNLLHHPMVEKKLWHLTKENFLLSRINAQELVFAFSSSFVTLQKCYNWM